METNIITIWFISLFSIFLSIFWLNIFFNRKEKEKKKRIKEWPSVNILIPAYNESKVIKQCLDAALKIDYPKEKLEVIVINDGSTDNTAEIVKTYIKRGIKLINKKNGGKATALNLGIKNSKSMYVACMDADSIIQSDTLKKMILSFDDEEVASTTSAMKVYKPKTLLQGIQSVEYILAILLRKLMGEINTISAIPGPFGIYRRDVLDKVGYFDVNNLTEDNEIAMRLQYHKYKIRNVSDAYVYTVVPTSLKGLHRQRLRWYRGLFRNSIKYKDMMFNRKYGNFGMFQFPMIWVSIIILIIGTYLFASTTFKYINDQYRIINLVGWGYYIPDFANFSILNKVLGANYMIIFPIIITFLIGFYLLRLSFKVAKESVQANLSFLFPYLLLYFPMLGIFWFSAIVEELIGVKRRW